jgi:hypothetical protein
MKRYKFDPKWDNTPVQKIGLVQWLKDHPSDAAKKAKRLTKDAINSTLNTIQGEHLSGEVNLYENVETFKEKWFHKGEVYYPIEGTRVPDGLPPIYIQWKDDYRKRYVRRKK